MAEKPLIWKVRVGEEEVTAAYEAAEDPSASRVLIQAHGASTHMDHRTTLNLAQEFRARGLGVVRFNFIYTEKKKGPPDRMPRLMECFSAVVERAREEIRPRHLFIGGHSMGGRAASMMGAEGFDCDGLLLLAYPLHPSGQPEKLRDAHLPQIKTPVLCMNGTRDELCRKELMERVLETLPDTFTMHWLEAADHGFHVQKRSGRTDEEIMNEIGEVSRAWVREVTPDG
jgi:predicted alpha/beta-hydrolase family hydrolase